MPGQPVWLEDGLKAGLDLQPALETYPFLGGNTNNERLRLVYENINGVIVRQDQPLSFQPRSFAPRRMTVDFITVPPISLEVM